ncbi:hypothetical protein BaRGS_00003847 [Batillaria attramentaria]|uniref:Uncharacterized protein n=1 Tax=Batillaria attramentaria TaxID=370345 RepID=A0ABD0M0J0_9CAEN
MKSKLILFVGCFLCEFVSTAVSNQGGNASAVPPHGFGDADTPVTVEYLLNTIDCLQWTSLILIIDDSTVAASAGQTLVDKLSTRTVLMTVYQLSREQNGTLMRFEGTVNNVVIYGPFSFLRAVLNEISELPDRSIVSTYHWLTVTSCDDLESIMGVAQPFENLAVIAQYEGNSLALWTKERQRDTTLAVEVKEWPFPGGCTNSKEDLVFPNVKYGLGGRTLQVVTIPEGKNGTWYKGLGMDMLRYLAESLNFTESVDGNWGHQLENGTWVGMTGMLQRQEVDFALAIFSVTAPRATVSDYTIGYFYDDLVLLASRPAGGSQGWAFYLQPFQQTVYIVIGASLLMVTALHVCMEHLVARWRRESGRTAQKAPSLANSVIQGGETFVGALIGRCVVFESQSPSAQVLMFSWLVMSLVTIATYTGKLTASSVLLQEKVPFSTLRELVRQDEYKWGFLAGTMDADILATSTNDDFARYYQGALMFAEDDPSVLSSDLETQVPKVAAGKYVFLTAAAPGYYPFKSRFCQLTILPERLFTTTYAIHLQKGSPYTRRFSEVIERAKELGLLEFWLRKWFPENTSCEGREGAQVVTVTLDLVQAAFLLAVIGLGLAALILAVERLAGKCCHGRSQNQSQTPASQNSSGARSPIEVSESVHL